MGNFQSVLSQGTIVNTSDATEWFSGVSHTSPYSFTWVNVLVDQPSGNTGVLRTFLATASSEGTYDITPIYSFSIASTTDPNSTGFPVQGPLSWRVGVQNSSASASVVTIQYHTDG